MDRSGWHATGIERHGDKWYHANRRAVERLWGTHIKPDDPKTKDVMPQVILAILDGHMTDLGYQWNSEAKEWKLRWKNSTASRQPSS